MRDYKVSHALKPFVNRILRQSYHDCHMYTDRNGQVWCKTNASSDTFHRVVQRAKCQKMSTEEGVLCMTSEEFNDPYMRSSIMRDAGTRACCVIDDHDGLRCI